MSHYYLFKVWITTIVIAPIVLMLLTWLGSPTIDSGAIGFIIFAIAYGLVLSLPTLILCYFLYPFLWENAKTGLKFKLLVISISFLGMIITIFFLYGPDSYNINGFYGGLVMSIIYGSCILISGLLYKIRK
jgi:hypothetical protein